MLSYHLIRDALEVALEHHGFDARALVRAVAELVPLDQRTTVYEEVHDKIRTAMWPPPRCACELAALAWRARPEQVPGELGYARRAGGGRDA